MYTRRHDDITVVAAGIQARCKLNLVWHTGRRPLKKHVPAASAGELFNRVRQLALFRLKFFQAFLAGLAVYVQHPETGSTGGNADIGVRPACPPAGDNGRIGGRVFYAVLRPRMFALSVTRRITACAAAAVYTMQRQHVPAKRLSVS
ncbi:MAG: hypothetical protein DDT38_01629 [Firmicutes bacterium]|nr:hypothetical protein [candidate division NPL-UPA2 bacterium]